MSDLSFLLYRVAFRGRGGQWRRDVAYLMEENAKKYAGEDLEDWSDHVSAARVIEERRVALDTFVPTGRMLEREAGGEWKVVGP